MRIGTDNTPPGRTTPGRPEAAPPAIALDADLGATLIRLARMAVAVHMAEAAGVGPVDAAQEKTAGRGAGLEGGA